MMKLIALQIVPLTLVIVNLPQCVYGQDRVLFPGKVGLPDPEPCDDNQLVCGGDEKRYPSKDILELVEESVALSHSEQTRAKFFPDGNTADILSLRTATTLGEDLQACSSRTQTVPRYARAKNIQGNWKYLVQRPNGDVQQVEITVCDKPDAICLNSLDSPDGPDSVSCRQLFRSQKLLAVNSSGVVEVDTFQLPSACVCNHRNPSTILRSGFPTAPPIPEGNDQDCNKISDALDDETTGAALSRPARLVIIRTPFQKRLAKLANQRRKHFLIQKIPASSRMKFIRSPDDEDRFEFGSSDSSADEFSFPDYQAETPDDYQESFTANQEFEKLNPLPCRDGLIICEEDPDYPEDLVQQALAQNNLLKFAGFFEKVFSGACEKVLDPDFDIETRSFSLGEEPLCRSSRKYIFPKKAENMQGQTVIIVNTDEYQQGVTVAECLSYVQGGSCTYGGQLGNFPEATECRQVYTRHKMLAISPESEVYVETIRIPSACGCHLLDKQLFL